MNVFRIPGPFHVTWGDVRNPALMVSIFGPTKELLGIFQYDDSFSGRPKELLKNVDALVAITEAQFMKCSTEERRRFVRRFAVAEYPTHEIPNPGSWSSAQTHRPEGKAALTGANPPLTNATRPAK